jgi:hypothetical protein
MAPLNRAQLQGIRQALSRVAPVPSPSAFGRLRAALFAAALLPVARLVDLGGADRLGANPVEFVIRARGFWTRLLRCLTLTLSPLRRATGCFWLSRLRRTVGCSASSMPRCTSLLTSDSTSGSFSLQLPGTSSSGPKSESGSRRTCCCSLLQPRRATQWSGNGRTQPAAPASRHPFRRAIGGPAFLVAKGSEEQYMPAGNVFRHGRRAVRNSRTALLARTSGQD